MVELHIQGLCVFLRSHGKHLHVYFSATSMRRFHSFSNASKNVSVSKPEYILTIRFVIISLMLVIQFHGSFSTFEV